MTGDTPGKQSEARCVVVYDGECRFCRRQVERIRRADRRGRLEYAARQTPGLTQRFPRLAEGDFNTGMRLVLPGGDVRIGADAVYEIARRLPRWRWIAWTYRRPGLTWICRRVYDWIAANRFRLAGRCDDGACATDVDSRAGAVAADDPVAAAPSGQQTSEAARPLAGAASGGDL